MLLKLIILGAIIYGVYRLMGGDKDSKAKRDSFDIDSNKSYKIDGEELVECNHCSTYVIKKEAIFYKGRYYCSKECLDKSIS